MTPRPSQQNAHLTFKGNKGVARHGWLRLTPAYGVRLVQEELERHPEASVVLDPFSGTGTTALCAASLGRRGHLVDLNPFLIWLAKAKTRHYSEDDVETTRNRLGEVVRTALEVWDDDSLWQPPIRNIARWWSPSSLAALKAVRLACDKQMDAGPALDLLLLGLCKLVITSSTAAFNHQSMSFRNGGHDHDRPDEDTVINLIGSYQCYVSTLAEEALPNPAGTVAVHLGDARELGSLMPEQADLLVTSPPYCNRMSYIRELRPYMYWLRFIDQAAEAGELDWLAVGGTWGCATSRLLTHDIGTVPPIGPEFAQVVQEIATAPGRQNGQLLANYVHKYFADLWTHIMTLDDRVVARCAEVVYIVGNSTFFGTVVPTEKWYARLLSEGGFVNVSVEMIRKRNSNKLLYEYAVRGKRP